MKRKRKMAKKPTRADIEEWFRALDAGGTGKVDAKDLKPAIKGYFEKHGVPVDETKLSADLEVASRTL